MRQRAGPARTHLAGLCGSQPLDEAIRQGSVYLARLSADELELVGWGWWPVADGCGQMGSIFGIDGPAGGSAALHQLIDQAPAPTTHICSTT